MTFFWPRKSLNLNLSRCLPVTAGSSKSGAVSPAFKAAILPSTFYSEIDLGPNREENYGWDGTKIILSSSKDLRQFSLRKQRPRPFHLPAGFSKNRNGHAGIAQLQLRALHPGSPARRRARGILRP